MVGKSLWNGSLVVYSCFIGLSHTLHHQKLESAIFPSTQEKEKQGLKGVACIIKFTSSHNLRLFLC